MATEIQFTGITELLAALERLAPDLAAAAVTQEKAIATQTVEAIRAGYPLVTGTLRNSVQIQKQGSTTPVRPFTQIAVTAPYATLVEFGMARTAPRPVFIPAIRRAREALVKDVVEKIRQQGLTVTGA